MFTAPNIFAVNVYKHIKSSDIFISTCDESCFIIDYASSYYSLKIKEHMCIYGPSLSSINSAWLLYIYINEGTVGNFFLYCIFSILTYSTVTNCILFIYIVFNLLHYLFSYIIFSSCKNLYNYSRELRSYYS